MFKFKVGDVVAIKGSEQMMSVVDVDGVGGEVSVIYSGTVGIVRGSMPVECLEPEEVARAREVARRQDDDDHRHRLRLNEIELVRRAMYEFISGLRPVGSDPEVDPDEPLWVPPDANSPSPKVDVQAETPSSEVRPTEATPEVKSIFV